MPWLPCRSSPDRFITTRAHGLMGKSWYIALYICNYCIYKCIYIYIIININISWYIYRWNYEIGWIWSLVTKIQLSNLNLATPNPSNFNSFSVKRVISMAHAPLNIGRTWQNCIFFPGHITVTTYEKFPHLSALQTGCFLLAGSCHEFNVLNVLRSIYMRHGLESQASKLGT